MRTKLKNGIKLFKITLNSKYRTKNKQTKTQKDEKLVLPKEYVENANLYQPVLNKIMTTRELQL